MLQILKELNKGFSLREKKNEIHTLPFVVPLNWPDKQSFYQRLSRVSLSKKRKLKGHS